MLKFGFIELLDIFLTAIILYSCYRLMKRSKSVNIFYGLLLFISFWIIISKVLEMKLLGNILDQLVNVGAIAIIILFQDEIRTFFNTLGAHERAQRVFDLFRTKNRKEQDEIKHNRDIIMPIVLSCMNMSRQKVGALIVLQNHLPLTEFIESGEKVDACISQRLIENIFFKNSPLHDGAMIICGNRITAAGCILPISHDTDIPKDFGLRHRAAKGISKVTDSMAIVVSEETGKISVAYNDTFRSRITSEELEALILKRKF